ncbi:MAG: ATP-binding cassette domain-containing protein [Methanoregula sp.]|nr:ATP-binding cassette domain-containing protein [Methanoregula sp.]
MITAENIRYRTLEIEDLRIAQGITSVIGPNGSGKTTFLKLLAGIAVPDAGTILVDGVLPRNAEIGWVNEFPDRNILFGSVYEEIASPLRFRHLPCDEIENRVEHAIESAGIQHLITRTMQGLSGGEKVLVALTAALSSGRRCWCWTSTTPISMRAVPGRSPASYEKAQRLT